MNYLEFKKLRAENKVVLGIENNVAMKYVKWLPSANRNAIYFWSWIAISLIPAGVLLGYMYSWWWLLLIPLHRTIWSANKKSAAEFLIESAEKDGGLFALVQNNSDWIFSKNLQSSSGDPVSLAEIDANHQRPSNTRSVSDLDVIDVYGTFLQKNTLASGLAVEDASKLPFPKARIKSALINQIQATTSPNLRDVLTAGLWMLPDWQDGVGENVIGSDFAEQPANENLSHAAERICSATRSYEEWKPIVSAERADLCKELTDIGIPVSNITDKRPATKGDTINESGPMWIASEPSREMKNTTGQPTPAELASLLGLSLTPPEAVTFNRGWTGLPRRAKQSSPATQGETTGGRIQITKIIDKGLAGPDDPIYKGGLTVSVVNLPKSTEAMAKGINKVVHHGRKGMPLLSEDEYRESIAEYEAKLVEQDKRRMEEARKPRSGTMREVMDQLSEAVYRYETFFKSPFPGAPIREIGEGRASQQDLLGRINRALSTQQADPEWEKMRPAPGTVEDMMYYQPRLKRLQGKKH